MNVQVDLTGLLQVHVQTSHSIPPPQVTRACTMHDKAGSPHANLSNILPNHCQDGAPSDCHGSVNYLHEPWERECNNELYNFQCFAV